MESQFFATNAEDHNMVIIIFFLMMYFFIYVHMNMSVYMCPYM